MTKNNIGCGSNFHKFYKSSFKVFDNSFMLIKNVFSVLKEYSTFNIYQICFSLAKNHNSRVPNEDWTSYTKKGISLLD